MSKIKKLLKTLCPKGVEYKTIGEIGDCYAGATPSSAVSAYWTNGSIPWMRSGEVNNKMIYDTEKKITQAGFKSCSTRLVPPYSVVMALAGQGKTRGLVARTRVELCTNGALCSIVSKTEMDSDFLYYFLTGQYQKLRKISSRDGTRGGLILQMIRAYRVPVPPLGIQKEIVRILDQFIELGTELEAELEARRKQYQYYRDALLTFEKSAFLSKQVRWMTLSELGTIVRGSDLQKKDFTEEGVGCIHYGEIYTHYKTYTNTTKSFVSLALAKTLKKVETGDLVIAVTSENVGDICKCVAYLGKDTVVTGGHAMIFKHKENPKYLSYYFQTRSFYDQKIRHARGTKVIDISKADMEKMKIAIPSLEEQERIVFILDKFDTLVNDTSEGLPAKIKARRQQYEHYRDQLLSFKEFV